MQTKKSKVSIILPTFNRAHLIQRTLVSILEQTYQNWECLIIDDGSTDNTKEIIAPFLKDKRLKYLERSSMYLKGPSGCRNQGLDFAQGEFIIFFDSDDIVHPENLQICLNEIEKGNNDFCRYDKSPFWGEWEEKLSEDEQFEVNPFTIDDIKEMITMEVGFACCTVMWRKQSLNGLRFNEKLSYSEEWEYYTRLLSQGLLGISINKILYFNRKHPGSNTGEFWNHDPVRRASKTRAVKLVVKNLQKKDLLIPSLVKYFIQMGFFLREPSIIEYTLEKSDSGILKKLKYRLGYSLYPVLRPLLKLKGNLKKLRKGV